MQYVLGTIVPSGSTQQPSTYQHVAQVIKEWVFSCISNHYEFNINGYQWDNSIQRRSSRATRKRHCQQLQQVEKMCHSGKQWMCPEQLLYDVKMVRRHLDGCFSDRIFCHFPPCQKQVIRNTHRRESVFCSCLEADNDKMIACDNSTNCTILTARATNKLRHKCGQTQTLTGLALPVFINVASHSS